MHSFNGNTKVVDNCPFEPVCIDACSEAAGAYYNGECLYTKWKSDMPWEDSLHINFKKFCTNDHLIGVTRKCLYIVIIKQLF